MLGPDPVNEGTMSGNVGPNMQIGSAFIQRPRDQFGISQWEKVGQEQGADKTIPRVGVDNANQTGYTLDDMLAQARKLESIEEGALDEMGGGGTYGGSHSVETLVGLLKHSKNRYMTAAELEKEMGGPTSLKLAVERGLKDGRIVKRGKGYKLVLKGGMKAEAADDGGEIPTPLQKKLRKKSPAYARPGEFDSASGGTAPGKKQKIKVETTIGFDKSRGFFITEGDRKADGTLKNSVQSKLNKALWKKWQKTPEKKLKYTGDTPMPSHNQ